MVLEWVVALMLAFPLAAKAEQIIQVTTGWCSPTVANVIGNVVIKCVGVPPPVHKRLTEELARLKVTHHLETQQLVDQANNWARAYKKLNERLQQLPGNPAEAQEIRQLIANGQIEAAAVRVDAGIERYDKQLATLAEYHYLRASIAILSFDMVDAAHHFRLAYQYQPANSTYLRDYASVLIEQGQLVQAESLLRQALPALRERARKGSTNETIDLLVALDSLGAVLISLNRAPEIDVLSDEALEVVKQLFSDEKEDEGIGELMAILVLSLGRNNYIAGRLDEAEKLLGMAFNWNLNMCSEKKGATFCGAALNAALLSAEVARVQRNFVRAEQRYQLALYMLDTWKWSESGVSNPQSTRARILVLSAEAWLMQNRYDEVEKRYRAVLDTWREGKYLSHQHRLALAHAHNKLGEFAMNRGQSVEGEALFQRALSLTKDNSDPALENESALASMNIALLYVSQGNGARALPYAMPAVKTFRAEWEKSPTGNEMRYAGSLFVLGLSQVLTGNQETGCATLAQIPKIEPRGTWDDLSAKLRATCRP